MNSYIFPAIDKLEDLSKQDLVAKLNEEFLECVKEITEYDGSRNRLALIAETLDVIHCCETILRHFGVDYSELKDGIEYVKLKNELRGYYEEDTRSNTQRNSIQRY